MAVIITPQSEVDFYYESDALNQSTLKDLGQGFESFMAKQEKKETEGIPSYFAIGSAVDTILTGADGEFEKQFYVSELINKPSDTEIEIVKLVFDDVYQDNMEASLSDLRGSILDAVNQVGWQSRWKDETRIDKIITNGSEYYEDLKCAFGKTILSSEQKSLIDSVVKSLKENERTKKYFDRDKYSKSNIVDIYYQLPIYFEYKGLQCKALLDMLTIIKDDKGSIISVHPIDLKTMSGNTIDFLSNLKRLRYDIQAAWYTEALSSESSSFKLSSEIVPDIIQNFEFVVESTTNPGTPLVFTLSDELMSIGKYGRKPINIQDVGNLFDQEGYRDIPVVYPIKGFDKLVDDYKYYEEQGWKENKLITKSKGKLILNWEGITY